MKVTPERKKQPEKIYKSVKNTTLKYVHFELENSIQ
jgi:hypothetical protein